jgi:hypothetical protein
LPSMRATLGLIPSSAKKIFSILLEIEKRVKLSIPLEMKIDLHLKPRSPMRS